MRSKKYNLIFTVILLALSLTVTAFAAQDQQIAQKLAVLEKIQGRFTFVVIGDNRSGDEIYKKLLSRAMERKPDFVVNTGDMIATPGNLDDWAKFWAISKMAAMPYFLTVGNHDANPKVPGSEKIYKEQVDLPGNELYYSFVAGNSLFIVLDSYLDDQEKRITGEQYKWLERILSNAKQKHRFVFVHHPLYTVNGKGKHAGNSMDRHPGERDRLQALFVKYNVETVFAGHEHFYQRNGVGGLNHVITGGGGAPLYADEKDGGFHHFIVVTVDGDRVSAEVMDGNNTVRDRF